MIWGVGLPRCGGQTLQAALSILTGKRVWHSITADRWHDSIGPDDAGAVEVYAPIAWLNCYSQQRHVFIHNIRDMDSWLASCERVYPLSQQNRWNHPIWQYPLSQFGDYYDDWHARIQAGAPDAKIINIIKNPNWLELCSIFNCDEPQVEFPNCDKTRPVPQTYSGSQQVGLGFQGPFGYF